MRINTPVTNNEKLMTEGSMIVTKTDLKGIITYANKDFIEISGFSETELVGQSHNVVRHPDMPVEAFADLWKTVKNGTSWNGIVKNRCKNGDYYWVDANVTPIRENGQVTGYVSVRRKPNQEQVNDAVKTYALLKAGKNPNGGIKGLVEKFRHISVKQQIIMTIAVVAVLLGSISGLGYYELKMENEKFAYVVNHKVKSGTQISRIDALMRENMRQLQLAAMHVPVCRKVSYTTIRLPSIWRLLQLIRTKSMRSGKTTIQRRTVLRGPSWLSLLAKSRGPSSVKGLSLKSPC